MYFFETFLHPFSFLKGQNFNFGQKLDLQKGLLKLELLQNSTFSNFTDGNTDMTIRHVNAIRYKSFQNDGTFAIKRSEVMHFLLY